MRMFPTAHHREFPYVQGTPHYYSGIFYPLLYTNQYFLNTSLLHIKITTSVTKSLYEDCEPCYLHLGT